MGHRVEGRRLREVLVQRRRDAVEAPLDPRLADALLEARGVADRERREAREGLEEALLELAEASLRITRCDAEQAAALARPRHLRRDRTCEALVCGVRNRVVAACVDRALG